jgi:serine/threonine-protein kinase
MIVEGKLEIERVLGRGGMGLVLVARHLHLDQRVAIKVLRQELAGDPQVVARFLREARASGRLRSEHVCRVFDVGQLDTGEPYFVMELLEGSDLAGLIEKAPLTPESAADYVLQASVAIAEAHAQGIVHRDLKSANLFITRRLDGSPLVKVLDFGIATAPTAAGVKLTQTATVIGSPGYMSPEHLRSARDVDARSDIWSLGVILYEAVTGRLPFVAQTITELAVKVVIEEPDPIGDVEPRYAAVVARCLQKEPSARYQTIDALSAALAPVGGVSAKASAALIAKLAGRSHVPVTESDLESRRDPRRSPRIMLLALGGTLVVAGAIAGAFVWRSNETDEPHGSKMDAGVVPPSDASRVSEVVSDADAVGPTDAAPVDELRTLAEHHEWAAILKQAESDPSNPIVVDARREYLAAEMRQITGLVQRGDCVRALAIARAAKPLLPDDTSLAAKARSCAGAPPLSDSDAAQAALDARQYTKALSLAETMLRKDATDASALRVAVLAECGINDADKAKEYFAKLVPSARREVVFVCKEAGVSLAPPRAPAAIDAQVAKDNEQATNEEKQGKHAQALASAERVLKERPDNGTALYVGAQAACHLKRTDKARELYARLPANSNAKRTVHDTCTREHVPID